MAVRAPGREPRAWEAFVHEKTEAFKVEKEDLPMYGKRLVVAGSRNFNSYEIFRWVMDRHLRHLGTDNLVLISGMAWRGADAMVLRYAHERGLPWSEFPAAWKELGKGAGHIRNAEMRKACTHVLAFWELKSPGTKNMIDISKDLGENLLVIVVADDDVDKQPIQQTE